MAGHQQRTEQIGADHPVPVVQWITRKKGTGVINHTSQSAKVALRPLYERQYLIFAGHVTAVRQSLSATRTDVGGHRAGQGIVDVRDHNAQSGFGKGECNGRTCTGTGTRHQCHAPIRAPVNGSGLYCSDDGFGMVSLCHQQVSLGSEYE